MVGAPRVIEDHGSYLVVEREDGTRYNIPKSAYNTLFASSPAAEPVDDLVSPPEPFQEVTGDEPVTGKTVRTPEPEPAGEVAAAGPVRTEPAPPPPPQQEQVSPSQRQGELPTTEDYARKIRESQQSQQQLTERIADQGAKDAESIAGLLEEQDRQLQEVQQEEEEAWNTAVQEGEAEFQRLKDLQKEHLDSTVDKDRWWKERSTGQKISSFIAVALSGFAAGRRGESGNRALDYIERQIDKDINLQLQDIAKKEKGIELQRGLIAQYWQQTGNEMKTYSMAKATALESVARQVELVGAKSRSENIRLEAERSAAELRAKSSAELENLRRVVHDEKLQERRVSTEEFNARTRRMQAVTARMKTMQPKPIPRGDLVIDPQTGEPIGRSIYGEKGAKELSDRTASYHKYRGLASDYEAALVACGSQYGGPGSQRFQTNCRTKLDDIQLEMAIQKAIMNNPSGRISDKDIEIAKKQIREGDSWTTSKNPLSSIRRQQRWADKEIRQEYNRHGMKGYDPAQYYGKPGKKEELTESQKKLKVAATPVKKQQWWIRQAESSKQASASFNALTGLKIKAQRGDREAMRLLETLAADEGFQWKKTAGEYVEQITRERELNKKEPDVTRRYEGGEKDIENIVEEGKQVGFKKYLEDGSLFSRTDYWPGTKKPKTFTSFDKDGKKIEEIHYNQDGSMNRRETF